MAVSVKLRYLRHSAKKLRPMARIFVGKSLDTALQSTALMTQDSAKFLHKALLMAQASAKDKELGDNLVVSAIMATEGPKIKRMRPNARGRSNAYQKHLAHLTVSLSVQEPKATKTKRQTKEKK